jgi:hypothetical protein
MVSKVLDIEAIKGRAGTVSDLEAHARADMRRAGLPFWQLGDAIKATLDDVEGLLARVEESEVAAASRRDEPSIVGALVGSLRAAGYQVTEPGGAVTPTLGPAPATDPTVRKFDAAWLKSDEIGLPSGYGQAVVLSDKILDQGRWSTHHEVVFRLPGQPEPFAWRAKYSEGSTEVQEERPWEYTKEVECTLVRLAPKTVQDWVPARDEAAYDGPVFNPDAAASDMLGEDDPGGTVFETLGDAMVTIDEPRICPNCELPLPPGGKCTRYLDCSRSPSTPDTERPEPAVAAADPPTKAEAPAAKGRRAEPPKLVTEWAPDGRDFEGYAKDLGCDVARVQNLVTSFKDWAAKSEPEQKQARWGGTFKAWAKARLTNQA